MRTFKLTLAYDGGPYAGWQVQADRPTIQSELEKAVARVTGAEVRIAASGRTDAGVHALGQVASFACETRLDPATLQRALNAYLPAEIRVLDLQEAATSFHALRDAVRKRYGYVIFDGGVLSPFERGKVWHHVTRLDEAAMARVARTLVGTHDFASFQSSGSERESTIRTVYELTVRRGEPWFAWPGRGRGGEHVWIEIEANGFLYNMVRNFVGTLVEVGRGAEPETWVATALAALDRRAAGPTAPAHGLYLLQVHYEAEARCELPTSLPE